MTLQEQIVVDLRAMHDPTYGNFEHGLLPTLSREQVIGVRTPVLRAYAKRLRRETDVRPFLDSLPHTLFEENLLHAFLLAEIKDFDECLQRVDKFLPYVDNWAVCDQMSPRCFARRTHDLLPSIERWLDDKQPYVVRFAMGMLMRYFLDDDFSPYYLERVASIESSDYYVKIMQAWYFATALAKQYDTTLPLLQQHRLEHWVHNKTIQKAIESFRVDDDHKAYLRTLREPAQRKKK